MDKSVPNEIFIHVAEKAQSKEQLLHELYQNPTSEVKTHFAQVNPHIKNTVNPGQIVILSPPGSQMCKPGVDKLIAMAKRLDEKQNEMSPSEKKILAKYHELLANIAEVSGAGYGVSINYFSQHKKFVEQILRDIEREYVRSYNHNGNLKNAEFLRRRKFCL